MMLDKQQEYLDKDFDPYSIRVIDLKKIFHDNDIEYPTRSKKTELVGIFNNEFIPKLRSEYEKNLKHKREKKEKKLESENQRKERTDRKKNKKNEKIEKIEKEETEETEETEDEPVKKEREGGNQKVVKREKEETEQKALKKEKKAKKVSKITKVSKSPKSSIKHNEMISSNLEETLNKPLNSDKIDATASQKVEDDLKKKVDDQIKNKVDDQIKDKADDQIRDKKSNSKKSLKDILNDPLKLKKSSDSALGQIKPNNDHMSDKNVFQNSLHAKRSYDDSFEPENDTSVYQDYSHILKKKTNHKNDFSSSSIISTPTRNTSVKLFPRDQDIKFEGEIDELNNTNDNEEKVSDTIIHYSIDKKSNQLPTTINPLDTLLEPESTQEDQPNNSAEHSPQLDIPILPSSIVDVFDDFDANSTAYIKQEYNDDAVPKINGPRNLIKIEKIQNKNESDNLNLDDMLNNKDEIEFLKHPPSDDSLNITPEMSYEEDKKILKQLQSEFDIETSRIEEESEKALKSISSSTYKALYTNLLKKIFFIWGLLFIIMASFIIYRYQRIQIGFCGHELYNPYFDIDRSVYPELADLSESFYRSFRLNCVPCPDHAICYTKSRLTCLPDYTLSKPLFWSIFGLIPTFNECILDSIKLKKIDKIVKLSLDILARRNAFVKCGQGENEEVGLTWPKLKTMIVNNLKIDKENNYDENFNYIFDKAYGLLTKKPELIFMDDGLIRSTSLSRLSIKCRLKRVVLDTIIRMKYYILAVSIITGILWYIFDKIDQWQKQGEIMKTLTKKILLKLQEQSKQFNDGKVKKKYVGKIQLRDYYLPTLDVSNKNKRTLWERVTQNVERNSNVNGYNLEVNGDIMRVWEWASDI